MRVPGSVRRALAAVAPLARAAGLAGLAGLVLLAAVALFRAIRDACAEGFDGPEYMGRQETSPGSGVWKCPDGYTDTGKNWDSGPVEGAKQCRKKASGKAQKFMQKQQRKSRKKCGPKPDPTPLCSVWKCKKVYGGSERMWSCAKKENPTDPPEAPKRESRNECAGKCGKRFTQWKDPLNGANLSNCLADCDKK